VSRNILVTGGAGYIGSHTVVALVERGLSVVIADDFSNSSPKAVDAIRSLSSPDVGLVEVDLTDPEATRRLFTEHRFDAVVHFAGLKAVGESWEQPLRYYRTNLGSTMNVLSAMTEHEVFDFVFSSSATVYGDPEVLPIPETATTGATNPYGRTKLMIEEICRDIATSDPRWRMTMLRYFNPVGAHPSGDIGEDPSGPPNNLVPYVMQVAVGRRPEVRVFGNDYDTVDGTGVRDYIHVVDLALGHLAALEHLEPGCHEYNLGTGTGASVLEIIEATARVSGRPVPYSLHPRRAGDIAVSLADPHRANEKLDWRADRSLESMLRDAWHWQSKHPDGFGEPTD
jgi:UDP-glucose 4-epimerase